MQYISSLINYEGVKFYICGMCLFLGLELRSMGFFLCVCTRVASLVVMEAKIFHLYGIECARGCFSRSVDVCNYIWFYNIYPIRFSVCRCVDMQFY
jgi:hypothetical protein